ncbi:MAG: ABC transporter ATP-binding protein [Clostridiales bacterium]|nr:ABC transporter ATP-binding protein [Clostridiales bacterium]
MNYINHKSKYIIVIILIAAIGMILNVIQPLLWGKVIAQLFEGNKKLYYSLIVCVSVIFLLTKLISLIEFIITQKVESGIIVNAKRVLYKKIYEADYKKISEYVPGELLNRIESDIDQSISGFIAILVSSVIITAKILVLLIIIASLSMSLTLIIFIGSVIITVMTEFLNKKYKAIDCSYKNQSDNYVTFVQQLINSISEVKILGIVNIFSNRYSEEVIKFYDLKVKNSIFRINIITIVDFLNFIIDILVMIIGGIMVFKNQLKIEHYIAFTMYTRQFYYSFKILLQNYVNFQRISNSVNRVKELTNLNNVVRLNNGCTKGDIEFRNISFKYNSNSILDEFNLVISDTSNVGIVGMNGCGKSTLINSLIGLYSDYLGKIYVNGVDVLSIEEKSFYDMVSVVSQDPFLFNLSIKENIGLFNNEITLDKIVEICKLVKIHEDICELEDGYNTIIFNNGNSLSKGQRKKIALARSLVKESNIIILDEATSNIDTKSLHEIMFDIIPRFADKILIFISHNQEVLKFLDHIVFLSSGDVKAVGSHSDLLIQNEEYKSLFKM